MNTHTSYRVIPAIVLLQLIGIVGPVSARAVNRIVITEIKQEQRQVRTGPALLGDPTEKKNYRYTKRIDVRDTKPKLSIQIWEKVTGNLYSSEGPRWSPIVVVLLSDKPASVMHLSEVEFITDLWAASYGDQVFIYVDSTHRYDAPGVHLFAVPIKTGKITACGMYFSRPRLKGYYISESEAKAAVNKGGQQDGGGKRDENR